jgi:hypothetical protein
MTCMERTKDKHNQRYPCKTWETDWGGSLALRRGILQELRNIMGKHGKHMSSL